MLRRVFFFTGIFSILQGQTQHLFSGEIAPENGTVVYLSIVEDYRRLSRVYSDQIIKTAKVDALGHFLFEGNNLPKENRIYRIHVDSCLEQGFPNPHVLGQCDQSKSILFIANNNDTLSLPKSLNGQIFCEVSSSNEASYHFLEIDRFKEEMVLDFNGFGSVANNKINSEKWFGFFQKFGRDLKEPLAELFIYDFLSDRRNETYAYYLNDLRKNSYYHELLERLENNYPNTNYTRLYGTEIGQDLELTGPKGNNPFPLQWFLPILLGLSLLINLYLFFRIKRLKKNKGNHILSKLTPQERKVVTAIVNEKTNKEIATELFISVSTVKTHINNLYKKLDVSKREDIKGLFGN